MACYRQYSPPGRPPRPSEATWVAQQRTRQAPIPHAPPLWFTGPPPPPRREQAFHLRFSVVAVAQAKPDAFDQCMADLLGIAILFCLRYCEHTKTNSHRRTTQFLFQYMQFHDANGLIPPDAASNVFLAASEINLFLDTQKIVSAGNPSPRIQQVCSMGTQSQPVLDATSILGITTPHPTLLSIIIMFRWAPPQNL